MPADIILLGAEGLHCEVAALTGESAPVENAVDCRSDVPLEARNLVFASTLVVAGEGWGLVVRTGDSTLIGCIAGAAGAGAKHRRSLLGEEMARLVGFVCAMSLATGCIFLAIGLGRSLGLVFSITQAFILTIVANVPEGLPASVISSLALAQKRCAARRVGVEEGSSLPPVSTPYSSISSSSSPFLQHSPSEESSTHPPLLATRHRRRSSAQDTVERGSRLRFLVLPALALAVPAPGKGPPRKASK